MAEPDRNKLVTALESLERTTIGQVKLQEMVAVTEHLKKYPLPAEKQTPISKAPINGATENVAEAVKKLFTQPSPAKAELSAISARRAQPEKFFIAALAGTKENASALSRELQGSGGGGYVSGGIMLFHLATAENVILPRNRADGLSGPVKTPLDEVLIHELHHAISDRHAKIYRTREPSRSCEEFRAIQTENALRTERGDMSLRYSYLDPSTALQEGQSILKQKKLTPEEYREQLTLGAMTIVEYNKGCTPYSYERVIAEARYVLQSHGIEPLFSVPKQEQLHLHTPVPIKTPESSTKSAPPFPEAPSSKSTTIKRL